MAQWQRDHEEDDNHAHREISARFDNMDSTMGTLATKEDIEKAVSAALVKFFLSKGTLTKNILLTTATILGAITVIAVAGKWVLGFIGFTYLHK